MEFFAIALYMLVASVVAQAITLGRIKKNENINVPFTFMKGVRSHWDFYLEPDQKKKYLWQYAGWVLLMLVLGVVVVIALDI